MLHQGSSHPTVAGRRIGRMFPAKGCIAKNGSLCLTGRPWKRKRDQLAFAEMDQYEGVEVTLGLRLVKGWCKHAFGLGD